jgi:hypothetical protein
VPRAEVLDDFWEQRLDAQATRWALEKQAVRTVRQATIAPPPKVGGFTAQEVGESRNVPLRRVEAEHRLAQALLRQQLKGGCRG